MVRVRLFLLLFVGALFGAVNGCGSSDPAGGSGGGAAREDGGGTDGAGVGANGVGASGTAAAGAGTAAAGTAGGGTGGSAGVAEAGGGGGVDVFGGAGGSGQQPGAGNASNTGDAGGAGDAGGGGGAGGGGDPLVNPITETVVIVPDAHGLVAAGSNGAGVHGNWFAENDCVTSPGDCTTNHVIGATLSEVPFDTRPFPTPDGKVCMRGVTASVNADAEYGTKWGARLVLPLNEGPNGELRPYDAAARGIGAFAVEVEVRGASMVDSFIRIALPVEGVADTHSREFFSLTSIGAVFVAEFKRIKQGNGANPFRVFDGSRITAIESGACASASARCPGR